MAYANAARIVYDAKVIDVPAIGLPDAELGVFEREGKRIVVVSANEGPRGAHIVARVRGAEGGARYTNGLGQTHPVPDGDYALPLDRTGFLHNMAEVALGEVSVADSPEAKGIVIPASEAKLRHGFSARSDERRPSYAVVWKPKGQQSGPKPEIEFPFTLDETTNIEVYLGMQWAWTSYGNLTSTISWRLDDRPFQSLKRDEVTVHWRNSSRQYLRYGQLQMTNEQSETISGSRLMVKIGTIRHVPKGERRITLRIDDPRGHDEALSAEIDILAVRPVADDLE